MPVWINIVLIFKEKKNQKIIYINDVQKSLQNRCYNPYLDPCSFIHSMNNYQLLLFSNITSHIIIFVSIKCYKSLGTYVHLIYAILLLVRKSSFFSVLYLCHSLPLHFFITTGTTIVKSFSAFLFAWPIFLRYNSAIKIEITTWRCPRIFTHTKKSFLISNASLSPPPLSTRPPGI